MYSRELKKEAAIFCHSPAQYLSGRGRRRLHLLFPATQARLTLHPPPYHRLLIALLIKYIERRLHHPPATIQKRSGFFPGVHLQPILCKK
jgi:hypothetical protein